MHYGIGPSLAFVLAASSIARAQTPAAPSPQRHNAKSACIALAAGLTNASADTRERSARSIYEKCPADTTGAIPSLNASLRKSVQMGNASAAAVLLLGRYRDDGTRSFLERHTVAKSQKVKLDSWQPPVPLGVAAAAGAVSAGSQSARERLKEGLGPIEEAEFLASAVPSIRDNHSLQLLLKLLDDQRLVNTGVPSGVEPKLRVADLALEAFVKRFALQPFPLRPGARYTPDEIMQVRNLVASRILPTP